MWDQASIASWCDDIVAASSRKRKREPLNEMDGNSRTPVKQRAKRTVVPNEAENEDTPRSSHHGIVRLPFRLHATAPSTAPDSDAGSSQSSSAFGSESQGSKKRKRSISPTKQMAHAQYTAWSVSQKAVRTLDNVDPLLRDVYRQMRLMSAQRGIIHPEHASPELERLLSTGIDSLDQDIFTKAQRCRGVPPAIPVVERIVERAASCLGDLASEPAWNSQVHSLVLESSLVGSGMARQLDWFDVTTATIAPGLAHQSTDTDLAQSRKVDYCIALKLPDYPDLGQIMYANGIQYLNQTTYGPVKFNPITISIETKLDGEGGLEARVQLQTWAAAQIRRLEALSLSNRNAGPVRVPLPLIVAQGHTWHLYYLQQNEGGTGGTLWDCGPLGTTATPIGTYQLIAGLQALMQWSLDVYQPWFETEILGPHLGVLSKPVC